MTAVLDVISQPHYAGQYVESVEDLPLSTRGLYHSHLGLFPFQVEGVARTFYQLTTPGHIPAILAIWGTGTGKTHMAMATSAMLFEDGLVDQVLVICERDKVDDWALHDYPTYTDLTVGAYKGSPDRRRRIRDNPPQVLVGTYETFRNDICTFRGKRNTVTGDGPLTEWIVNKKLRTMIVFDESTKLRGRSSKTHVAHDYLVNRVLRRGDHPPMLLGLSATTIEDDPEDWYNTGRIIAPELVGGVAAFYDNYVESWSEFGMTKHPSKFKNLTRNDENWDGTTTPLVDRLAPVVIRKRKSDPDVRDFFPRMVEEPPTLIELPSRLADFYDTVRSTLSEQQALITNEYKADGFEKQSFAVLRSIAAHPMSLLRSQNALAQAIASQIGQKGLEALGAPKEDAMLKWAGRVGSDQGVIFTFYGQSVLPLLSQALRQNGYLVSDNHGSMDDKQKRDSKAAFVSGDTQFFLSSDCGARGLNLGMGSALLHYELPSLYSLFVQRSNRIHRIDSIHESVIVNSMIAKGTVEDGLANKMIRRNEWSDKFDLAIDEDSLHEDYDPGEDFMSADDRRRVLQLARSV